MKANKEESRCLDSLMLILLEREEVRYCERGFLSVLRACHLNGWRGPVTLCFLDRSRSLLITQKLILAQYLSYFSHRSLRHLLTERWCETTQIRYSSKPTSSNAGPYCSSFKFSNSNTDCGAFLMTSPHRSYNFQSVI